MHSYDLSAIVGLATQLAQVMEVDSVQRCVSIMLKYHGSSSHDGDTWWRLSYCICCDDVCNIWTS